MPRSLAAGERGVWQLGVSPEPGHAQAAMRRMESALTGVETIELELKGAAGKKKIKLQLKKKNP